MKVKAYINGCEVKVYQYDVGVVWCNVLSIERILPYPPECIELRLE